MSDLPCPHCDKRFGDANSVFQHAKAKHGRRAARAMRPPIEREPSLGEELAEAIIAWHGGEEPAEYLRAMFPERFR